MKNKIFLILSFLMNHSFCLLTQDEDVKKITRTKRLLPKSWIDIVENKKKIKKDEEIFYLDDFDYEARDSHCEFREKDKE